MTIDPSLLKDRLRRDLDMFSVPDVHTGVGLPLSTEWYAVHIEMLRNSLVEPYHTSMRDEGFGGDVVVLPVIVVIDDAEGALVIFDPAADEFALAIRSPDPVPARGVELVACGIRGNPVDCFLAA